MLTVAVVVVAVVIDVAVAVVVVVAVVDFVVAPAGSAIGNASILYLPPFGPIT